MPQAKGAVTNVGVTGDRGGLGGTGTAFHVYPNCLEINIAALGSALR
jgi:hypothetical protein